MVKMISYAVSQRFQLLFISLGVLAGVGTITPYIVMALQDKGVYYNSLTNGTLLIANTVLPLLAAAGAAMITHRRGLARWWVAVGVGFMAVVVDQLLMWVGSVVKPASYDVANIIALVLSVGIACAAVWIDRKKWQPAGILRHWRVLSVGGLYFAMIATAVLDMFRSSPYGQTARDEWQSLGMVLLVLALVIVATLVIYRRLPAIERVKRVLLALTGVLLASMAYGGLMAAQLLRDADWTVSLWLGLSVFSAVYVLSVWWLMPTRERRTIRK